MRARTPALQPASHPNDVDLSLGTPARTPALQERLRVHSSHNYAAEMQVVPFVRHGGLRSG